MKSSAVIGYGSFGKLLVELLSRHMSVKVFDRKGVTAADLPESATAVQNMSDIKGVEAIFIATGLNSVEDICRELIPLVNKDTIVADVCSVKVEPSRIMSRILGGTCQLLATHPLFGPQTILKPADTIGQKLVWHELGAGDFTAIRALFADLLGVEIVEMTPEAHDKEMAWVHGLTFFTGRALLDMDPPRSTLGTNYYQKLIDLVTVESEHSEELFMTIQRGNPYTDEIRQQFMQTLQKYEDKIREDKTL